MIFSEQDVIKDPPFSKLDLISCRNLLIYMGGGLQKKLVPLATTSLLACMLSSILLSVSRRNHIFLTGMRSDRH